MQCHPYDFYNTHLPNGPGLSCFVRTLFRPRQATSAAVVLKRLTSWLRRLENERLESLEMFFTDPSAAHPGPVIFAAPTKALSVIVPAYNEEDRYAERAQCPRSRRTARRLSCIRALESREEGALQVRWLGASCDCAASAAPRAR